MVGDGRWIGTLRMMMDTGMIEALGTREFHEKLKW
jgi:hypothetical protein